MRITKKIRSSVFSQMAKHSVEVRKKKYLDPASPFYEPDYFKKIRRGEKIVSSQAATEQNSLKTEQNPQNA